MTFFATMLFMVLVFWRPQEWLFPGLYGWPMLDGIVIFSLICLLVELNEGHIRFPSFPQVYLIVGLWVAAMMSHVAHTYFDGVIFTLQDAGKICLFTFLLVCAIDRLSRLRWVVLLIVAMAVLMAVHALMQKHLGYGMAHQSPLYIMNFEGEVLSRSVFFGIFEDPNDLAQVLAFAIPLGWALSKRLSPFSLLVGLGLAILLTLGILATRSRGGLVALSVTIVSILVLGLPSRFVPIVLSGVLIGSLWAAARFGGQMMDDSAYNRVIQWGEANQLFKQNPVFGIGFGMFSEYFGLGTHSAFVSCYTEMGFAGYWCWFGLLQLGLVGCWRTRAVLGRPKTDDEAYVRRLAGLGLTALLGLCGSAYFLNRTWFYPFFLLVALLAAIPEIARQMLPEGWPPLLSLRKDLFAMGTLGSALSMVYIYVSIVILNRTMS